MKFTNIIKTAVFALGVVALTGCIRETFPKTSTITQEQLMAGQMDVVAENLLKGIPSSMMYVSLGSEHSKISLIECSIRKSLKIILKVNTSWLTRHRNNCCE